MVTHYYFRVTRAAPLPPKQRRAAIIEATLPLIQQHGTAVTSRQVAEASGIAEGTVFRAFDSLQDLIEATIRSAFSAEKLAARLDATDLGPDLESKTRATLALFDERFATVRSLMMVAHQHPGENKFCVREELDARNEELAAWLTERFAQHAALLRVSPGEYVRFLRLLAMGMVLHIHTGLSTDQIVSMALDGALRKDQP